MTEAVSFGQQGFILHRRPWKESSWLADFLLEREGRMRFIVRGARRQGKNRLAWMQPFMPLQVQWKGQSSLPVLTQAEPGGSPFDLQGKNLLSGFYINELLCKLLPQGESCSALFSLYHWTLQALAGADGKQLSVLLRRFELALLEVIGHGLDLQQIPADQGWWRHDAHEGWVPATADQNGAIEGRWLQQLQPDRTLSPELASALRPVLHDMLTQIHPGAGEQSRALLRAWMKLE